MSIIYIFFYINNKLSYVLFVHHFCGPPLRNPEIVFKKILLQNSLICWGESRINR